MQELKYARMNFEELDEKQKKFKYHLKSAILILNLCLGK